MMTMMILVRGIGGNVGSCGQIGGMASDSGRHNGFSDGKDGGCRMIREQAGARKNRHAGGDTTYPVKRGIGDGW